MRPRPAVVIGGITALMRPRPAVVIGGITALMLASSLSGGPAVAEPAVPTIQYVPGGLIYSAADPSAHETVLTATSSTITITEYGPQRLSRRVPRGCAVAEVAEGGLAATCPLAGRPTVRLRYGDADDYIDASELPPRISIDGSVGGGFNAAIGGLGTDLWIGGPDDEALYGNSGADVIRAGDGYNIVHGNSGDDLIVTGDGIDTVFGDASDDTILSGAGVDFVYGGSGDDSVSGGPGTDFLSGGSGNDVLLGLGDDDELNGGSGSDRVLGGSGDDLIRIRDGGPDSVICGSGDDTARVDPGTLDRADTSCETLVRSDPTVSDPDDQYDIQDESVEEAVDAIDERAGRPGWHRALWNLAFHLRHHR